MMIAQIRYSKKVGKMLRKKREKRKQVIGKKERLYIFFESMVCGQEQ